MPAEERDDVFLSAINPTLESTTFIDVFFGTLYLSRLKAAVGLSVADVEVSEDDFFF